MSFKVTGKLIVKGDTQEVTASFKKRELVVMVQDGQYENPIKFELMQDRCSELDNVEVGQDIEVSFNLRGREWNGKYFTNLNAWRISKPATEQTNQNNVNNNQGKDDMPF